MTKAQIQVPEELWQELRSFAWLRERSLSETFRRGAGLLPQVYPEPPAEETTTARMLSTSGKVGWKDLGAAQLRDAAFADADPHLG